MAKPIAVVKKAKHWLHIGNASYNILRIDTMILSQGTYGWRMSVTAGRGSFWIEASTKSLLEMFRVLIEDLEEGVPTSLADNIYTFKDNDPKSVEHSVTFSR